jgi:hypothetical protein
MIFHQTLKKYETEVKEAVTELLDCAFKNQTHRQDILLIIEHGFYNEFYETYISNGTKFSPYVIGPKDIGHSEYTHHEFLHWYSASHLVDQDEFLEKVKEDEQEQRNEKIMIHVELGTYLKFWEADMILKKLYQLSNLAQGNSYDWRIEMPTNPKEGSKQAIIREKIRDGVKNVCPKFYELMKSTYVPQIRNAIAHSQFFFMNRTIQLLNYSKYPKAFSPMSHISFEEWTDYFHKTLMLYNEIFGGLNEFRDHYAKETEKKGFIEIRITKDDGSELIKKLGLRKGFKAWVWYTNLTAENKKVDEPKEEKK